MTTLVVYADTGDWSLSSIHSTGDGGGPDSLDSVWPGSGVAVAGASILQVEQGTAYDLDWDNGSAYATESFAEFDTSALGAGASISAATMALVPQNYGVSGGGVSVLRYDYASISDISAWRTPTQLAALTRIASHNSTWTMSAYNDLTSDAAMLTQINKTGITKVVLANPDMVASSYTEGYAYLYSADTAGTTQDPKLTITYTSGSTGVPVILLGGL